MEWFTPARPIMRLYKDPYMMPSPYKCYVRISYFFKLINVYIYISSLDKPVFDKNNEEAVTGIENEPLIITLKAEGNPSSIAYTWTKDGLPITQASTSTGMERIVSDGPVLNITKLSRHDAGTYSCEALNSQGSNLAQVNITVQCKLHYLNLI